jgi:hypothetical protein
VLMMCCCRCVYVCGSVFVSVVVCSVVCVLAQQASGLLCVYLYIHISSEDCDASTHTQHTHKHKHYPRNKHRHTHKHTITECQMQLLAQYSNLQPTATICRVPLLCGGESCFLLWGIRKSIGKRSRTQATNNLYLGLYHDLHSSTQHESTSVQGISVHQRGVSPMMKELTS